MKAGRHSYLLPIAVLAIGVVYHICVDKPSGGAERITDSPGGANISSVGAPDSGVTATRVPAEADLPRPIESSSEPDEDSLPDAQQEPGVISPTSVAPVEPARSPTVLPPIVTTPDSTAAEDEMSEELPPDTSATDASVELEPAPESTAAPPFESEPTPPAPLEDSTGALSPAPAQLRGIIGEQALLDVSGTTAWLHPGESLGTVRFRMLLDRHQRLLGNSNNPSFHRSVLSSLLPGGRIRVKQIKDLSPSLG
jgi:hypothetical protein